MSAVRTYAFVIATAALSGACASTGAAPRPFPTPSAASPNPSPMPRPPAPSPRAGASIGYSVTGTALQLRGTPYRNGGADPSGFDCSGFVQYVFAQHGVIVPRTVSDQFREGKTVRPEQLRPGDLVFFSTVAPGASHVGIALGGDEFVHAPSSTGEVRVERLSASYWAKRFIGARRVL
jgi:cell wall-associated NlpC family hydrolase